MLRSLFRGRRPEPDPEAGGEAAILRQVRKAGGRFERVVLTRNRRVMASVSDGGRTLRLHEAFLQAPPPVIAEVGILFSSRSTAARSNAKAEIRRFLASAVPAPSPASRSARRRPSTRHAPADAPHLERLRLEFERINREYFDDRLPTVPLRLSGRMVRRNGHFSPDPLEIAISRTLCQHGVAGEAERTLRHEMVHLWQWVEGRKPGHGLDFRRWARRLDIHPRATRSVRWARSPA